MKFIIGSEFKLKDHDEKYIIIEIGFDISDVTGNYWSYVRHLNSKGFECYIATSMFLEMLNSGYISSIEEIDKSYEAMRK